ncbi:hypothetical protein Pint_22062 [Pistacia integerrima]|uniref:Uncharacterized protein n=1 Tax=Pistacia integerrima TaxID=434235 RepID=A0ACC0YLE0_9ROSI|nr:hypothetical protein Pint_22062 [Pistacia integerrima]
MQNPINSAAKKSSRAGETRFQHKARRPVTVVQFGNSVFSLQPDTAMPTVESTIKWSDVQFPEEWKLRDENPPESKEYTSPPRIEFQGGFRPQF